MKGDKSFELGVDFSSEEEMPPEAPEATEQIERPSVVVFEPAPLGLAQALSGLGLAVRVGTTGVDVMALVSSQPPAVVLCAPSPDAERRRLLAAALRLRFPSIPLIYVSTHAHQEEAVRGAIREGARAVIAWPLPPAADVQRVLAPYLRIAAQETVRTAAPLRPQVPVAADVDPGQPAASKTPHPLSSSDEGVTAPHGASVHRLRTTPRGGTPTPAFHHEEESYDEARTIVMNPPEAARSHAGQEEPTRADAIRPLPVPLPALRPRVSLMAQAPEGSHDDFERETSEPTTQPNLHPTAGAVLEAMKEKRGEIGQLLAAISPFLWSLEDAARWAQALGESGDSSARNHARTLHLLAKILAQLQARIDEIGA